MSAALKFSARELLELAAKAAGLSWEWNGCSGCIEHIPKDIGYRGYLRWRPLDDDGDALRLAVQLGMSITTGIWHCHVNIAPDIHVEVQYEGEHGRVTPNSAMPATRRAIVLAAAEIGRSML